MKDNFFNFASTSKSNLVNVQSSIETTKNCISYKPCFWAASKVGNYTKLPENIRNLNTKNIKSQLKHWKSKFDQFFSHFIFDVLGKNYFLLSFMIIFSVYLTTKQCAVLAQTHRGVHLGFPEVWDGDKHTQLYCPSTNIPTFLDGYFLCQLSASYGSYRAPAGRRLTHMIDAIGAVSTFRIVSGQVTFSARYYPAKPFKIWEFYDRNMSMTLVPWVGWSDYNMSAVEAWERIGEPTNTARFHPSLDFWRVGHRILAGTEAPRWLGYEFDVRSLDKFKLFPIIEKNEIFQNSLGEIIPISMSIHERTDGLDADGSRTIWGSFVAVNFVKRRFYQGIFTMDKDGVRHVVGMYEYSDSWEENACAHNDEYIGDKSRLAGYIHSITSTENFVILPITSLLFNPCKFKKPPSYNDSNTIHSGGLWGMDFYEMEPIRFLIFDKRTLSWLTKSPLYVFPSMFITHQLNAYESADSSYIIADMIVYDNHDPYVKYFYMDFLTAQTYPSVARLLRFTLDIREMKIMYSYLIPQETISADFPQINHAYDGQKYTWAYLVEHPFANGNAILKINVENVGGHRNKRFMPQYSDAEMVLHEPWFVSRPNPSSEDDGVLIIRALNLHSNRGVLFIVDAITMTEIGRANVPISIPFGFHNRYFSRTELDLPTDVPIPISEREEEKNFDLGVFKSQEKVETKIGCKGNDMDEETYLNQLIRDKTLTNFWKYILKSSSTTTTRIPPSWIYIEAKTSTFSSKLSKSLEMEYQRKIKSQEIPLPLSTISSQTGRFERRRFLKQSTQKPIFSSASVEEPLIIAKEVIERLQDRHDVTKRFMKIMERNAGVSTHSPLPLSITIISSQSGGYNRLLGTAARKLSSNEDSPLREIYEKSLHALCRWLPRILEDVTIEGCIQANDYTKKWMRPNGQIHTSKSKSVSDNTEPIPSDTAYANPRHSVSDDTVIRPVLKPVIAPERSLAAALRWYSNYRQPSAPYTFHWRKRSRTLK